MFHLLTYLLTKEPVLHVWYNSESSSKVNLCRNSPSHSFSFLSNSLRTQNHRRQHAQHRDKTRRRSFVRNDCRWLHNRNDVGNAGFADVTTLFTAREMRRITVSIVFESEYVAITVSLENPSVTLRSVIAYSVNVPSCIFRHPQERLSLGDRSRSFAGPLLWNNVSFQVDLLTL